MSNDREGTPQQPSPSSATAVEMPKPASPKTEETDLMALASAGVQFMFASVTMMIGNKAAIRRLPLPCTVVIIQVVGTLALLGLFKSKLQAITVETAKIWLPIAVLFSVMIFTSLKTFVYVGVSTVIIFRNIGAILTTIVEYQVRGTTVNAKIVISELLIVVGAVMYGHGAVDFSWTGFFWIMLNLAAQVAYGVTLKKKLDDHTALREMTKYTMSLYNNALALPMIFVVAFAFGEENVVAEKIAAVDSFGWVIIALTCFFGFLISTSGFGLQKLVSATTFLVINNMTKFVNIGLGVLFLGDTFKGMMDSCGCLVALLAGMWYSYETMKHNEAEAQRRKKEGEK